MSNEASLKRHSVREFPCHAEGGRRQREKNIGAEWIKCVRLSQWLAPVTTHQQHTVKPQRQRCVGTFCHLFKSLV